MKTKISFKDLYSFSGFRACAQLRKHSKHPGARVVTLKRRQKKLSAHVDKFNTAGMTVGSKWCEIWIPAVPRCIWSLRFAGSNVENANP